MDRVSLTTPDQSRSEQTCIDFVFFCTVTSTGEQNICANHCIVIFSISRLNLLLGCQRHVAPKLAFMYTVNKKENSGHNKMVPKRMTPFNREKICCTFWAINFLFVCTVYYRYLYKWWIWSRLNSRRFNKNKNQKNT